MKIYYESSADMKYLAGKTTAVLGYGSQGHAHALNLKESGSSVIIGLRKGSKSWKVAEADGFEVYETAEAAKRGDVVMVLLPDQLQEDIYKADIEPNLEEGNALMFAHGFCIHFGRIVPPKNVDVYMVAPKGPGHLVRRVYTEGGGVPALVAVQQDYTGEALEKALAHARGIGSTRAGVIETTFTEETETDLFGEQAVLCGGVTELVKNGFEVLVEAGYQPEIAYFECLHELKLIVDLFYEGGISGMYYSVSETAEYGGMVRGKEVINSDTKKTMEGILDRVRNGSFADQWINESKNGQKEMASMRNYYENHQIEKVGKELRKMMNWIKK